MVVLCVCKKYFSLILTRRRSRDMSHALNASTSSTLVAYPPLCVCDCRVVMGILKYWLISCTSPCSVALLYIVDQTS